MMVRTHLVRLKSFIETITMKLALYVVKKDTVVSKHERHSNFTIEHKLK